MSKSSLMVLTAFMVGLGSTTAAQEAAISGEEPAAAAPAAELAPPAETAAPEGATGSVNITITFDCSGGDVEECEARAERMVSEDFAGDWYCTSIPNGVECTSED